MHGIVLVDVPATGEESLETIHDNLPIGDVETVAEKLVAEIKVAKPAQCPSHSRSATRRTNRRCARWS